MASLKLLLTKHRTLLAYGNNAQNTWCIALKAKSVIPFKALHFLQKTVESVSFAAKRVYYKQHLLHFANLKQVGG